jgi:hypothetical protein
MWFKIIICASMITTLLLSCSPAKKTVHATRQQKIELFPAGEDSTEYELIIIDPGFDVWFEGHRKPVWYYSKEYLSGWNNQYVVAWNAKVRDPMTDHRSDSPFILEIDYRPGIDYGIDLNYKLYNYFLFVEATWGRILPFDRKN